MPVRVGHAPVAMASQSETNQESMLGSLSILPAASPRKEHCGHVPKTPDDAMVSETPVALA